MDKFHSSIQNSSEAQIENFLSKLIIKEGCWSYDSHKARGYHKVRFNGAHFSVHRLVWIFTNEKNIPDNMVIRHKCDNAGCVNPSHLEIGTQQDNIKDMHERGRFYHAPKQTHCLRGHEFDEENTRIGQDGKKYCRACLRIHDHNRYNKKRLQSANEYYAKNKDAISLRRKEARKRKKLCDK